MKIVYVDPSVKKHEVFLAALQERGEDFEAISNINDCLLERIEIAIIWREVPEVLKAFSNLKLLLVCGSGVDHIINHIALPLSVPMIRLVDPHLRSRVAHYVLSHIDMYFHEGPAREGQSLKESSFEVPVRSNGQRKTIGILGLGLIGTATAELLTSKGYEVCAWVRTSTLRRPNDAFVGMSDLKRLASRCDVLVCQLPLTVETQGILNSELFHAMPRGSYLINVGRGGHLNENDLIAAIDSGHLSGACLDVFNIEPLPADHIFNLHPNIVVTPHIAGIIDPQNLSKYAITVIEDFCMGKKVEGLVNYKLQY